MYYIVNTCIQKNLLLLFFRHQKENEKKEQYRKEQEEVLAKQEAQMKDAIKSEQVQVMYMVYTC